MAESMVSTIDVAGARQASRPRSPVARPPRPLTAEVIGFILAGNVVFWALVFHWLR